MKYYIQVVGATTKDSFPSILVHFDSGRYLFNAGEGTQRFSNEHKVRLAKLRHVFFTRDTWDCLGGLPGMLLTLADIDSVTSLDVSGPTNLSHILAGCREFIFQPNFPVRTHDIQKNGLSYQDENLTIHTVVLKSTNTSGIELDHDFSKQKAVIEGMFPNRDPKMSWSAAQKIRERVERLPSTTKSDIVLCYICQGPKRLGKLDLDKLAELGVRRGPLYGKLLKGESVTLPNGRVVHPEECVSPSTPGGKFIIIECPDASFIPSIVESRELNDLQMNQTVECVVHLVGDGGILRAERYKKWMMSFPPSTQHIYLNLDSSSQEYVYLSSALLQERLSDIDRCVFPLLSRSTGTDEDRLAENQISKVRKGEPLLMFQMEPKRMFDESELQTFKKRMNQGIVVPNDFGTAVQNAKDLVTSTPPADQSQIEDAPVVYPLGTSSAMPAKYRNVSSTLLRHPHFDVMLDCGEGTFGQLFRTLGVDSLVECLKKLRVIFISHMHADHHLGLFTILRERRKLLQHSDCCDLLILAPNVMKVWIDEYSEVDDQVLSDMLFVSTESIAGSSGNPNPIHGYRYRLNGELPRCRKESFDPSRFGLSNVKMVRVPHCPTSYAIVATTTKGFKFVYSGDCRPSLHLAEAGKGAHLLIHEATLDDDKPEEAAEKRHSTIGEARYAKIPKWRHIPPEKLHSMNIATAFDSMRLELSDFGKIKHYLPAIELLVGNDADD